jgi:hypothetical protein
VWRKPQTAPVAEISSIQDLICTIAG